MSTGSNMSDAEENTQNAWETLERVMSKMTNENGTSGSGSVCDWTWRSNDAVIKKYFKVRRKLLSPDELVCQYFWNGIGTFHDEWMGKRDVQNLLSFLRLTTCVIDTKEADLYFPHGGRSAHVMSQNELSESIQTAITSAKFNYKDTKALLDCVEGPSFRAIAEKMLGGVRDWLSYLGHIIKKDPARTVEYAFEQLARNFILACGLQCVNGNSEEFTLPDTEKKCEPDLIFAVQDSTSPYWGAVVAKRMSEDPSFKHFFNKPTKGIMKRGVEDPTESKADLASVVEDECIPSKKQCVTYIKEEDECIPSKKRCVTNIKEEDECIPSKKWCVTNIKEEDECNPSKKRCVTNIKEEDECIPSKKRCVTYSKEDSEDDDTDPGGSNLTACVRDTVDIFFGQLFGRIISLDCHQPSHRNRRMGIGVVGFRIFFVAFYAKPGVPFAKIPETKGAKTEVHIAGPLCILNAKDREDIARILLVLATEARTW